MKDRGSYGRTDILQSVHLDYSKERHLSASGIVSFRYIVVKNNPISILRCGLCLPESLFKQHEQPRPGFFGLLLVVNSRIWWAPTMACRIDFNFSR